MPAGTEREKGGGGAESYARYKQYDYRANSSLVLTAEQRTRDPKEPSGEPETLVGKRMFKMGDRAQREAIPVERKKPKKQARDTEEFDPVLAKRARKAEGLSVLDVDTAFYTPKTRETRWAYEQLLALIQRQFGDQPHDVLRGAADEILAVLKNDRLNDPERQREVGELLGGMDDDTFHTMVDIGKAITDYAPADAVARDADAAALAAGEEDIGVAVEFEDEDEEEDQDADEVVDTDDDEDGDDAGRDTELGEDIRANIDADEGEERQEQGINVQEIDAYWLQRRVVEAMGLKDDATKAQKLADEIFAVLQSQDSDTFVESTLVEMLQLDQFALISQLVRNRTRLVWCIRLARAQSDEERQRIETEMEGSAETAAILQALRATRTSARDRQMAIEAKVREEARRLNASGGTGGARGEAAAAVVRDRQTVDFEMLALNSASGSGGHFMPQGLKIRLPQGSFRTGKKGYEEVHVPAPEPPPLKNEQLVKITDMPDWAQPAFKGMKTLNRIQSKVCDTALYSAENILMCAPTGAGKTNVAMLTIMHELGLHRKPDGAIDTSAFKIVYVAPMKALVAEMVGNFTERLSDAYGITVRELTGDMNLSKSQIDETQIIVTTPEKWDIITRKSGDRTYTNLVRLLIIDEIHLLHDDRGPVLESIVARTIRHIETTQEMIRLVGLSATLPNYEDVAAFLRVNKDKGLFFFDAKYRPCPLAQQYIGVSVKKPLQRFQLMNEICYEKILQSAGKHQTLIFVHSRKETGKTAKYLKDQALAEDQLLKFMKADAASREILQTEAESCKDSTLKDILPFGFAIHHAGMTRADRQLVEDLFADGHIQVLVSTATLAWGVNLPAHTVIIKGTQVYNPVHGRWQELSPLDVMQMMGRAGRPQYDTFGEGIIITAHTELQYYLGLLNEQLPIESQYVQRIPDNLNAEIVLGTVQSIDEAAKWLSYTYLYIRMLRNPSLYGVPINRAESDKLLLDRRLDLAHSAAMVLDKHNLIRYDQRTGNFQVTDLGRIASHYYVTYNTISTFNSHLKQTMGEIELLRLFSLADEFKYIIVREEEKLELAKLVGKVPVPVKESIEEPTAKINVLLQAYISNLKLEGLALISDMVYVTQSAGRLMRCLYEVVVKRGWAGLASKALALCKMVNRCMWAIQTPLRQFSGKHRFSNEVLARIEKKDLPWERWYDLNSQELGELVRLPKLGKTLHKFIHLIPRVELSVHVLPVTRTLLKVDLTITPDFRFDTEIHGFVEPFWIICEDQDSEFILYNEYFLLKSAFAEDDHTVSFTVPISEPLPPQYFVRVVSDRWLGSEAVLPVSFRHLILPEKFAPPTELLDLQPLPVTALRNPAFERLYRDIPQFNPIQTQVFTQLYNSDDNCLVCAPTGSGKTICAEFAILRMIAKASENPPKCVARCVYIAPLESLAKARFRDWKEKFGPNGLELNVVMLTGEAQTDIRLLEKGNIVISTPEIWDMLSRRWKQKQRKVVREVALFIVDEMHLIGGEKGPTMEIITSRMRYINAQTEHNIRIIALAASVANAKELGEWIGATSHGLFNFPPSARPVPLEIHIQGFDIVNFEARMQAMVRPVYTAITKYTAGKKPALVFVPTRKHARTTAHELLLNSTADALPAAGGAAMPRFLNCMPDALEPYLENVRDKRLVACLQGGVGYLYETMPEIEQEVVNALFTTGAIRVVVATAAMCWGVVAPARLVAIMGTQYFDGTGLGGTDYPVSDLLQMMGHASRPQHDESGVCLLLCHTPRKEYYKKFLFEPIPVESHLNHYLHDHFNAEVVSQVIENKQDAVDYLTWTFFYRRLAQNPNYYNMTGRSHRHISDYLSDLVEQTLSDLEQSKALAIENDMDLEPLNLGLIAAYYYVAYTTIELFSSSLTPKTKLKGLLAILSNASEFDSMPIRPGEEDDVKRILSHAPYAVDNPKFTDPHVKTNALLQAHFARMRVSGDLAADQREILLTSARLLQAMVDVIASSGALSPALAAMELSQMVTQGLTDRDTALMQLPHFTRELCKKCNEAGLESVFDLLDMDADDRVKLLSMTDTELVDVATFCNRYPDIDLQHQVVDEDSITSGSQVTVQVVLQRTTDDAEVRPVDAPRFPKPKDENWWLVVGNPADNALLAIKRITLQKKSKTKLEFTAPKAIGSHALTLFFMCDSYMGCDQEYEIKLNVGDENDAMDQD